MPIITLQPPLPGISAAGNNSGFGQNLTVTWTGGIAGNLAVVYFYTFLNPSLPAGWTSIFASPTDYNGYRYYAYGKILDGTENGTLTINCAGGTSSWAINVTIFAADPGRKFGTVASSIAVQSFNGSTSGPNIGNASIGSITGDQLAISWGTGQPSGQSGINIVGSNWILYNSYGGSESQVITAAYRFVSGFLGSNSVTHLLDISGGGSSLGCFSCTIVTEAAGNPGLFFGVNA